MLKVHGNSSLLQLLNKTLKSTFTFKYLMLSLKLTFSSKFKKFIQSLAAFPIIATIKIVFYKHLENLCAEYVHAFS